MPDACPYCKDTWDPGENCCKAAQLATENEELRQAGAAILRFVFDSGLGAAPEAEAALAVFARLSPQFARSDQ